MADKQMDGTAKSAKKPFNKKKWRELKYSSKAKLERWDEKRRVSALRKYHRELKKDGKNMKGSTGTPVVKSNRPVSAVKQAQIDYERAQEENKLKNEELERIRKEKSEAIKAYREKKAQKFKKLSQKTRKGQPVMKGRMELLLEKIEREYGQIKS